MTRTQKRNRFWPALPAVLAALLALSGCGGAVRIPGQWLTLPGPGDGRLEDFSRSLTSHLFEDGMMVGLGNDADFLYVFFTPDMRRERTRPGGARLAVWLDVQGGRARRLALEHVVSAGLAPAHEPGAGMPGEESGRPHPGAAPGQDGAPPRGPEEQGAREFLKIIDRAGGREAFIAVDGSQGPALRLDSGWGDFTYQLRIPFRPSGDWPGLNVKAGQVLAVGFDWQVERRQNPRDQDRKHPRGGRGGGEPGGGPGMGGMPPGAAGGAAGMPGPAPLGRRRAWVRTVIAAR